MESTARRIRPKTSCGVLGTLDRAKEYLKSLSVPNSVDEEEDDDQTSDSDDDEYFDLSLLPTTYVQQLEFFKNAGRYCGKEL